MCSACFHRYTSCQGQACLCIQAVPMTEADTLMPCARDGSGKHSRYQQYPVPIMPVTSTFMSAVSRAHHARARVSCQQCLVSAMPEASTFMLAASCTC